MEKFPLKKLLFASFIFLASLSACAFFLASQVDQIANYIHLKIEKNQDSVLGEPLFYSSIGQVPINSTSSFTASTRYTLEFSVFNSQQEAEKELDRLNKKGIDAFYTPVQAGKGIRYKVRAGVYERSKIAKNSQKKLRKEGIETSVKKL